MESSVFLTFGIKLFPNASPPPPRSFCAFILGSMVLVSVSRASSPVADGPMLASRVSETDVPSIFPSLLWNGNVPAPAGLPQRAALIPPGAPIPRPARNHGNSFGNSVLTDRNQSPSQDTRLLTSGVSPSALLEPPSALVASSSELAVWSRHSSFPHVRPSRDLPSAPANSLPIPFSGPTSGVTESSNKDTGLDLRIPNISILDTRAQGIHLVLNPPEMVVPSHRPFIRPNASEALAKLTLVPPEEFYPTNTMEADWGSGDYLETLTFMGLEDEFSMITSLPNDLYDLEGSSTEAYDTSFPSRVVLPLFSLHMSSSHTSTTAYKISLHSVDPTSVQLSHIRPTKKTTDANDALDLDWADTFPIEPTEILLPDMNSLEYYTTLQAKENARLSEQRSNLTSFNHVLFKSQKVPHITPTRSLTVLTGPTLTSSVGKEPHSPDNEESNEMSAPDPLRFSKNPSDDLLNGSKHLLEPSVVKTSYMSTTQVTDRLILPSLATATSNPLAVSTQPSATQQAGEASTSAATPPHPTDGPISNPNPGLTSFVESSPTGHTPGNFASNSVVLETILAEPSFVSQVTSEPPVTITEGHRTAVGHKAHPSTASSNKVSSASFNLTTLSTTGTPLITTSKTLSTARPYLCNITKSDTYLIRVGFPAGATIGYAKAHIREILKSEFNRSVELQVLKAPPNLVFRVVSGPVLYTAVSVINALRQSAHGSSPVMTVLPVSATPDHRFQVHSVLQFVPGHVDVRMCNFSERIQTGLTMAYAEVRRRSQETTSFSVHMVNITTNLSRTQRQQRAPVDITFAVRDASGYLRGSEVSNHLRLLNMVEFSFYLGFPVLQIAEPIHYPELNVTHLLRSSWVRTVLLGVLEQRASERTFQAKMERRLALLLGEALGTVRRWRRATRVGNNSLQIVRTSKLEGSDHPLEMVYFVEGPNGERLAGYTTSSMLNRVDVQRAAIVLGYRVQGTLAQPVEKLALPPSETQNNNMWIIVGVVVPVLLVLIIIIILYWKLCRSDKLEFQPDAMSAVQQRQKLQAPSVKGFDFAKLHLGQHSKDDIMVIQEPASPPVPIKELSPLENQDVPTPKSMASPTKMPGPLQRRGRISPTAIDSASERSSGRESPEETIRPPAIPNEGKLRKTTKIGLPPVDGTDEQASTTSIFEHVDRASRPSDSTRRTSNKIQLIAMQPMPAPPQHSPTVTETVSESARINREIQVALRHKSEIEHHRNKIRLRAIRRGHYDFPAMDDLADSLGEPGGHQQIYHKAQLQIDRILDPDVHMPSIFIEPRKSGRGKRSPRQRKKPQVNGSLTHADRDRLIPKDGDATYRKFPGVNNVAYVSDPDQPLEDRSLSPTDDVFTPCSPPPGHAPPPPPYVPPQPSIAEARQQMQSLLDDAFALVSPSSQGSIPLPCSPPARGSRAQWDSSYPAALTRYTESGMSPPALQGIPQWQGLGSGHLPTGDSVRGDQLPLDALYSSGGLYAEELPSSARPRPVGGSTGAQLHHLTQVGLSSRISAYPGAGQAASGQPLIPSWGRYRPEEEYIRPGPNRDQVLGFSDSSPWVLQMPRASQREPSAPPAHLAHPEPAAMSYPSAPPEDAAPTAHSSASLIKAIREELMRLSQKQSTVSSYHN